MIRHLLKVGLYGLILFLATSLHAQDVDKFEPGRFDQGKMWTFENAPVDYFKETYGLEATPEWLEDARKSALRFASWCSGSFISENGLILTNHHCSRGVVAKVMKEGENFDDNGFYAIKPNDERRVPDLYVDQLVQIKDITSEVAASGKEIEGALGEIQQKYEAMDGWKDLVLETRNFYSGGKFSLYGFKRHNDVRLVLYPELAMGYFGGDPDNFTYPRYNLDFTLFRAYDEKGSPLKPTNFYEFNPDGITENEAVFIVGNPGSTGRYLTMAQLNYQKEITAPAIISFLRNNMEILLAESEKIQDVYKKDSVVNEAFGYSNSLKAYTGRLKGYNDLVLMTKKQKKEDQVRSNLNLEGDDPWVEIEKNLMEARKYFAEVIFLSPSANRGKVVQLIHLVNAYNGAFDNEEAKGKIKTQMMSLVSSFDSQLEGALFTAILQSLQVHSKQDFLNKMLEGKSPHEKAKTLIENSLLINNPEKFFKLKQDKLATTELMKMASILVPVFQKSGQVVGEMGQKNSELEKEIMNLQFTLSGLSSPPDATFSPRIADGIVKSYEYNGTLAPIYTTYYGLYDRHYSHGQAYPWNLPERWMNPPMELLKAPLNFVCTADIIGGNSGSPVINKNQEVVGLVFDGNIESLPGYFIYDDTYNRTVSVHAGGIFAALKYIYKADRIVKELD